VESQLAQTTAELASLKERQQQLEHNQRQLQQRNVLLERMAKLKSQSSIELSQPAQNVNAKLQTALQVCCSGTSQDVRKLLFQTASKLATRSLLKTQEAYLKIFLVVILVLVTG